MGSVKATARQAGILYTVMAIMGIMGFVHVFGRFVIPGNPAATVQRIADHQLLYRIAILNDFVANILFLFLVATLYDLFKDVNRKHALLMVLLVAVPVAGQFANLVDRLAPLSLLRADYLSSFSKPQLDAVAHAFLRFHGNAAVVAVPFWGLWLFPFGSLVMESGFFPRILGILLMVAGVGYLAVGFTTMVFPDHVNLVSKLAMPLYFGELPIIFWLLIKGARASLPVAQISRSAA